MSSPSSPGEEAGPNIDSRLLEEERRYLERARSRRTGRAKRGRTRPSEAPRVSAQRDLCGLALSGGGIRSATFNLGLLQGLHQLGLLEMFDYLATVSGGGYVGGFWTAWRHYHGKRAGKTSGEGVPELFPSNAQGSRGAKLSEVGHLREFSNFLNPRLGLMSMDTGRMVVAALSAIIPALVSALSLIVLALLCWWWLAGVVLITWPLEERVLRAEPFLSYALMFLLTCGGLLLGEWMLLVHDRQMKESRGLPPPRLQDTQELEFRRFGYYLPSTLMATGVVMVLWVWLLGYQPHSGAPDVWRQAPGASLLFGPPPPPMPSREWLYMFFPALPWLGAAGTLVMVRWWGSRFVTEWMQRTQLAAVDRVISRLLLLALLWSAFAGFWLAGWRLYERITGHERWVVETYTALVGIVTALTALLAKAHQFLGRRANTPVTPTAKDRLISHLPQFLAYVTLGLIVLGMVQLIFAAQEAGGQWFTGLVVGAATISVLALFLFDPNLLGLHVFYRGRIARTFIGAAHGEAPGQTEPHTKDDVLLHRLRPRPGPLHLICCAANDLSSADPMASLYRGADSAVLSSVGFSVGKEWKSWKEIGAKGRVPTLAAAMTASGAAFNSHMGSMSMRLGPAVTFLMTAFNLRLGLWAPHPTLAHRRKYERVLVGLPFYKELFGRSRARSRDVLLSDGGHFENLALYELVRRHCRFILVSDCGMDSDATFDDFANAVRRVREDFGVEIRIDLSPLRADEKNGLARQPLVVGDIEYPDGDTGVLLLLKPTLTGNEPPDITQYRARNADFPHETTGDQFYDEAQWEAYRRLGEHVALTAFRPLRETTAIHEDRAAQLFARARYEWLPVPTGYEERFSRFVARAAELDALLQRQGDGRLFREVFKEINELDREAKEQARMHGGWLRKVLPRHPAGDGDSHPEELNPRPEELSEALHILRLALLFMEEVFLSEALATRYNHPAYQGLMNYFARWAYSMLFRAWWPLLKTQYSQRFTHFLEQRFHLRAMSDANVGRLSMEEHGFAMSCWKYQGGRPAWDETPEGEHTPGQPPIERLISYQLNLPCEGTARYYIQAAQLIVRTHRHDGTGRPLVWDADGGGGRQVLAWQGDAFYVPPGLWGSGIREDFLRRLTSTDELIQLEIAGEKKRGELHEKRSRERLFSRGMLLVVRIFVDREAQAARRNEWAEGVQFYRSQGFEEPEPRLKQWLNSKIGEELDWKPALPWAPRKDEHWLPYWLVRTYDPSESAREDTSATSASEPGAHEGPALH